MLFQPVSFSIKREQEITSLWNQTTTNGTEGKRTGQIKDFYQIHSNSNANRTDWLPACSEFINKSKISK